MFLRIKTDYGYPQIFGLVLIVILVDYIMCSSYYLEKIRYDFIFINPSNISLEIATDIDIDDTIHYLNSIELKHEIKGNFTDYIYFDDCKMIREHYINRYIRRCFSYESKIYTLWGMFSKHDATLFYKDKIYKQYYVGVHHKYATLVGYYNEVICIGSCYSWINWGHMFQDFFHTILLFPQELLNRSKILQNFMPIAYEFMSYFGIRKEQLIKIKEDECIYCNIIYTLTPRGFLSYYSDLGMKVKNLFFKIYNLDSYKADKFCFSNRSPNTHRHILNIEEIYNVTQSYYHLINFTYIKCYYPTVKETAIVFAQIKFLFMATGSNLVKTYFMQNESVIVSVGTPDFYFEYDNSVLTNAIFTRVFFLQFKSSLKHYSGPGTVNVTQCFRYIQIGMYCVFNGHWPATN